MSENDSKSVSIDIVCKPYIHWRSKFVCRIPVLLTETPPIISEEINFLHHGILFYLQYLHSLMKTCHPDCCFTVKSTDWKYLGLEHFQMFRRLIPLDLIQAECKLVNEDNPGIWREVRERKRVWNHSWLYSIDDLDDIDLEPLDEFPPPSLKAGRESALLLLECLHSDPQLWIRVQGRWLLSCEFYCYMDHFQCVSFCIDTESTEVHTTYKDYDGEWHPGPEISFPCFRQFLPSCMRHVNLSTLKDDCLITMLMNNPHKLLTCPRISFLQKQRIKQLYTCMMRFPWFESQLTLIE